MSRNVGVVKHDPEVKFIFVRCVLGTSTLLRETNLAISAKQALQEISQAFENNQSSAYNNERRQARWWKNAVCQEK